MSSDEFGAVVVGTVETAIARHCLEVRPYWLHDLQVSIMEHVVPDRVAMYYAKKEVRDWKERGDRTWAEKKQS